MKNFDIFERVIFQNRVAMFLCAGIVLSVKIPVLIFLVADITTGLALLIHFIILVIISIIFFVSLVYQFLFLKKLKKAEISKALSDYAKYIYIRAKQLKTGDLGANY